jgi:aromatic-amino-acid transaminase
MALDSIFSRTELLPRDPIVGLTELFKADPRPDKINLSVGTYSDEKGDIPLLDSVRTAEGRFYAAAVPRNYQPIDGSPAYNTAVRSLLFGEGNPRIIRGEIVTVQTVGGTGALRVGADYLRRLFPTSTVYISKPTWENHRQIFVQSGFHVCDYPYYDEEAKGVDFASMLHTLSEVEEASIVILHACCHNPTGADLDESQWRALAELIQRRRLVAFLDMAYQGFGSGLEDDAFPLRLFAGMGIEFLVANSFSKSFSLYGERVGALSVVAGNADESARVLSNLKQIIRTLYSNPPTHGGVLVLTVLADPTLRSAWIDELASMRNRIVAMRHALVRLLSDPGCDRDFSFILHQRGMFSFTGLSADQVERLRENHAIYALSSGRICAAALNDGNIEPVSRAIRLVI